MWPPRHPTAPRGAGLSGDPPNGCGGYPDRTSTTAAELAMTIFVSSPRETATLTQNNGVSCPKPKGHKAQIPVALHDPAFCRE
jgi:hypothetical protein